MEEQNSGMRKDYVEASIVRPGMLVPGRIYPVIEAGAHGFYEGQKLFDNKSHHYFTIILLNGKHEKRGTAVPANRSWMVDGVVLASDGAHKFIIENGYKNGARTRDHQRGTMHATRRSGF